MGLKVVFFGNGHRGVSCLEALKKAGYSILRVVAHPKDDPLSKGESFAARARSLGLRVIRPEDPSASDTVGHLSRLKPDVMILAGYGKILRPSLLKVPRFMCVNLHAGRLPQYRGSSPMNWALIKGDRRFSLTIIRLSEVIDAGDILEEKRFGISEDQTIKDLHDVADRGFPKMMLRVLKKMEAGTLRPRRQKESSASYYPRRFPDDGIILWDFLNAREVHNRVRALTEPYPCAFTYLRGRKVHLLETTLNTSRYYGEPGRIYKRWNGALLVGAKDQCLWVRKAVYADTREAVYSSSRLYENFLTLRGWLVAQARGQNENR